MPAGAARTALSSGHQSAAQALGWGTELCSQPKLAQSEEQQICSFCSAPTPTTLLTLPRIKNKPKQTSSFPAPCEQLIVVAWALDGNSDPKSCGRSRVHTGPGRATGRCCFGHLAAGAQGLRPGLSSQPAS